MVRFIHLIFIAMSSCECFSIAYTLDLLPQNVSLEKTSYEHNSNDKARKENIIRSTILFSFQVLSSAQYVCRTYFQVGYEKLFWFEEAIFVPGMKISI